MKAGTPVYSKAIDASSTNVPAVGSAGLDITAGAGMPEDAKEFEVLNYLGAPLILQVGGKDIYIAGASGGPQSNGGDRAGLAIAKGMLVNIRAAGTAISTGKVYFNFFL